jgi:hypothetical protein
LERPETIAAADGEADETEKTFRLPAGVTFRLAAAAGVVGVAAWTRELLVAGSGGIDSDECGAGKAGVVVVLTDGCCTDTLCGFGLAEGAGVAGGLSHEARDGGSTIEKPASVLVGDGA